MLQAKCFCQKNIFLPLTKLDIKDGLPGINIRTITKDKFGFMWFATQDGISRFDGRSFIDFNSYKVDNKRKILGTDFFDLKTDVTGQYLWALSSYGGLNKIELTTCNVSASYSMQQSTKTGTTLWYKCFVETTQHLIIGSNEGIIINFNKAIGKTDYSFSLKSKFACGGELEKIMVDDKKQVWFFISDEGILITDSSLTKKVAFINSTVLDKKAFTFTNYAVYLNYILVTTTQGLKIIDINTLKPVSASNSLFPYNNFCAGKELHCISIDATNAIISGKYMLYKINLVSGSLQTIQFAGNYEDRSWLTLTSSIYLDDQKIWLGSQYGVGWLKNTNSPFLAYFNSFDGNNIKIKHAVTLCSAWHSTILACADDGLYAINVNTSAMAKFGIKDYYYAVFPVNKGYFIASGISKGLQLFNHNFSPLNILSVYPELAAIRKDTIMSSARLGDSIVFMASQNKNGLYIWNTISKKIEVINTGTGKLHLLSNTINRLYLDAKKRLWIICDNDVAIFDYFNKSINHLTLTNPATKALLAINMDVCETKNGFWLACYGTGVAELSADLTLKKVYDAKDGLINLGLYKIFSINDSMVLSSSNNGLALINIKTGFIKRFTVEDGLQSNSFEEASGCVAGNFIYAGGINGFTKIDISRLVQPSTAPKVTFSAITFTSLDNVVTDTLNLAIKKISVPSYITEVTVNFSAINYSAPDKVRFAYRISEKGGNWNFTDQNFIQSFRLAPGTYTLQVKAANEDGLWSNVNELKIVFMPTWYQTWVFNFAVIIIIGAFLYALYRYRVRQILKLERIRQKLSSDLHDDIGSTLNSVNLFTKMAMMQADKDEFLQKIKEGVQNAIASVRDIIWILDKEPETINSIFNRIGSFSQPFAKAAGCLVETNIDYELTQYSMHGQEKQNVYLIIKEAVNNCIKYAACSLITVQAKKQGNTICIYITDDGKGFDNTTGNIKISEGGTGHGMKNMMLRSAEIKWKFSIQSAPRKGTTIKLAGKLKD